MGFWMVRHRGSWVGIGLVLGLLACSHKDTPARGDSAIESPPPRTTSESELDATLERDASVEASTRRDSGLKATAHTNEPSSPPSGPQDLAGKIVLHAGDSMVGGDGGLTKALATKFRAEGAKFVTDYEVSVSISTYARTPRLRRLLEKHKPDIVILTLGANDVFVPFPQTFAVHVESIVKKLEGRECYWMSPPTWKPDSGIVDVIKEHVGSCKFFDSRNLTLKRAGDHIHPTEKGGADWAELFWAFYQGRGPSAPGLLDAGAGDSGQAGDAALY